MDYILETICNLIYFSYFILIGHLFFRRKNHKFTKYITVVMALLISVIWPSLDANGQMLVHVVGVVIILLLWFDEKKRVLVPFYVAITSVLSLFSLMLEMLLNSLFKCLKIDDYELWEDILIEVALLIYILVLCGYFRKYYNKHRSTISAKYLGVFAIILFMDTSIVLMLGDFVLNVMETSKQSVLLGVYIGVVLGILIQFTLLINAVLTRNVYKENEQLAKRYLDNQKEHYIYLEKREHETRKFRHDIKNHLLLLEKMFLDGKYDMVQEYLSTLNEKVDAMNSHISVNNGIADAILNKFDAEAREQHVEIKVKGHFPMECYISAFDMCTILSNLLSNAILAASQCDEKKVFVEFKYTSEEIFIRIENAYVHDLNIEKGELLTTKTDSTEHGFGLGNAKECVEKTGGYLSVLMENNRFIVMLSMRNKQKESL